jgi:hypothetical protein
MQPVQERPAARVRQGSKNRIVVHANIMEPFGYLSSRLGGLRKALSENYEALDAVLAAMDSHGTGEGI